MKYFDDVNKYLLASEVEPPVGCSQEVVDKLERNLGFALPLAYKEYLLLMGADYFGVMQA